MSCTLTSEDAKQDFSLVYLTSKGKSDRSKTEARMIR